MASRGDGIETRILAALDWARAERNHCEDQAENPDLSAPAQLAQSVRSAGLSATIEILEEVIEPGRHSSRGPST